MPRAANQWNTYDITAKGGEFTVILNGIKTVDGAKDSKLAKGRIALQYGGGIVEIPQGRDQAALIGAAWRRALRAS